MKYLLVRGAHTTRLFLNLLTWAFPWRSPQSPWRRLNPVWTCKRRYRGCLTKPTLTLSKGHKTAVRRDHGGVLMSSKSAQDEPIVGPAQEIQVRVGRSQPGCVMKKAGVIQDNGDRMLKPRKET